MKTPHELVIETLERIQLRISQNIDTTGTRASGKTQASMHIVSTPTGGMLVGRKYFQSVEVGRPAGRVPFRFVDIIKQWMIDKGIAVRPLKYKTSRPHKYTEAEMSLNRAAGAIAHNIETQGTRLHREGGRTDIYTDVINEEVAALRKQIAASVASTLSQTLHAAWMQHSNGDATYQYLN